MFNRFKSSLESHKNFLGLKATTLSLMFLSLACTEVKVVEVPGETVYVYLDQGPDDVNQQLDQFSQDMETVLDFDLPDSELPEEDFQVPELDMEFEMQDMELPQPELDMEFEMQDMELPQPELDMELEMQDMDLEMDSGTVFEPSEDLQNLELRPCEVDNSHFDVNQLLRTQDFNFIPRVNNHGQQAVFELSNTKYWRVSTEDFLNPNSNDWPEVACFEYSNQSDVPILLRGVSFEIQGGYEFEISVSFPGSNLDTVNITNRGPLTINPENSIIVHPNTPFRVMFRANLNQPEQAKFLTIQENSFQNFQFQNVYLFELFNILQLHPGENNQTTDFSYEENVFQDGIWVSQEVVNYHEIFSGTIKTFLNSHSPQPIDTFLVCESSGGTYQAQLNISQRNVINPQTQSQNITLVPGTNRIPFQIPALEVNDRYYISLQTNPSSSEIEDFQAPQDLDTIQCKFERSDLPQDLQVVHNRYFAYYGDDLWESGSIRGGITTWLNQGESEISYLYFNGDVDTFDDNHEYFEFDPRTNDELVVMHLSGVGNLESIEFETNLSFNNAILAEIQVLNYEGVVLESQPLVISRGQSTHSIEFQNLRQIYGSKEIKIVAIDNEQVLVPQSFDDLPPRIKFNLTSLVSIDENQNPVSIDANHWNFDRSIPFVTNEVDHSVYYYFNKPDLYLTPSFINNTVYDLNSENLPEEIDIANFSFENRSLRRLCIEMIVLGKRGKEQELYNLVWFDWEILVPNRNVRNSFIFIDFRGDQQCPFRVYSGIDDRSNLPFSSRHLNVRFAGEMNPETVNGVDTLQLGLMYVQGYYQTFNQSGEEIRTPFNLHVPNNLGGYSLYNPQIFNQEGTISEALINENFEDAPKSHRITFINEQ